MSFNEIPPAHFSTGAAAKHTRVSATIHFLDLHLPIQIHVSEAVHDNNRKEREA